MSELEAVNGSSLTFFAGSKLPIVRNRGQEVVQPLRTLKSIAGPATAVYILLSGAIIV